MSKMNAVTGLVVFGFILVVVLITVFYLEPKMLGHKSDEVVNEKTKLSEEKRTRLFKGTIAVSVVYGAIAVGILLGMYFVPRVRELLGEQFYPFSITFVVGAILLIIFLILQIVMFEPPAAKEDMASLLVCPDYWTLEKTPENIVKKFSEADRPFVTYSCVPQKGVYGNTTAAVSATPDGSTVLPVLDAFNQGKSDNVQMNCNRIYPAFLAMRDKKDFPNKPNTLRCDLSSRCTQMPWTAVCP